jgi:hypothetical protein
MLQCACNDDADHHVAGSPRSFRYSLPAVETGSAVQSQMGPGPVVQAVDSEPIMLKPRRYSTLGTLGFARRYGRTERRSDLLSPPVGAVWNRLNAREHWTYRCGRFLLSSACGRRSGARLRRAAEVKRLVTQRCGRGSASLMRRTCRCRPARIEPSVSS